MSKIKEMLSKLIKLLSPRVHGSLVHYISGGEALPQPLSPREELELIQRVATGDKAAKDKLIEHNLRLVVYISKRFENTWLDIEDLISVGTIGLIKAVNSFSLDRNIKLATFASRCIENEILMYLRKMLRVRAEVSFDEPLNVDSDGNILVLSDILGSDEDEIYKELEVSAEKEALLSIYKQLPQREKEILEMRFGILGKEELTQKEIAEKLGISQSYISRLEKRIIAKLKREIEKKTVN